MAALLAACVSLATWCSEPPGQQYTLRHGDAVLFWRDDEMPPRYGKCCFLWGYYPVIWCEGKTFSFQAVSWSCGEA